MTAADGARWALRRPPMGELVGNAHDMGREHTVVSALASTDVPVAPIRGYCTDPGVTGAPFYVMDWIEGPILRSTREASAFGPDELEAIGRRVVETLVRIHAVDPDAAGLGDLGRKENYVARQIKRWTSRWEKGTTRDIPLVEEVGKRLGARIPEQGPATIVHGDYRLDNMILTGEGEVAAVVDWELCTLGDPLADVGMLIVYWAKEEDQLIPLIDPATKLPGFQTREQVRDLYAELSGRDLGNIDSFTSRWRTGRWRSFSRASTTASPRGSTASPTRRLRNSARSSAGSRKPRPNSSHASADGRALPALLSSRRAITIL